MPGFSLALLLSSGAFGPATDSFLVKLLPLCSLMSPVLAGRGSVGHPPHPPSRTLHCWGAGTKPGEFTTLSYTVCLVTGILLSWCGRDLDNSPRGPPNKPERHLWLSGDEQTVLVNSFPCHPQPRVLCPLASDAFIPHSRPVLRLVQPGEGMVLRLQMRVIFRDPSPCPDCLTCENPRT